MKLSQNQFEEAFKKGFQSFKSLLFLSRDEALIQDYNNRLEAYFRDKCEIIKVTCADFLENPDYFLYTQGLFEKSLRIVFISQCSDKLTNYLQNNSEAQLPPLFLMSLKLKTTSSLVKLHTSSPTLGYLPLWEVTPLYKSQIIHSTFKDASLPVEQKQIDAIVPLLSDDLATMRLDLEKICLYFKDQEIVDLEAVQTLLTSPDKVSLDDFIYAFSLQLRPRTLEMLQHLYRDGLDDVAIIRSLIAHIKKLCLVKQALNQKLPIDKALSLLKPPLFFKYKPFFTQSLSQWTCPRLYKVIDTLIQLELKRKRDPNYTHAFLEQVLLKMIPAS